ncbi:MAG: AMP-binding protein [Brucellaceae bacterium]|nr:AMP-binding protein [Brucellaceae bacterium]
MSDYFDAADTIDAAEREASQFARLPGFLARVSAQAPGLTAWLSGIDFAAIDSRAALATLPVLRKDDLMRLQAENPPFGGFVDLNALKGGRAFLSPGPVFEPQAPGADPWGGARALHAAGFRPGDMVWNTFSYHLTPGGLILDESARALGCTVFPGGVGNTEQQIEAAAALRPRGFVGTPDTLKIMLDKAAELGKDLSSIEVALVSGGALFPSLRAEYANRGVRTLQCYATADLGLIAYESARDDGEPVPGMLVNEGIIVEIVRPGTSDPVPDGEVGEIVVTTFNPAYPLIRFGTGDMSKMIAEPSPCGRTAPRIAGWMGRADQRTKIKGMFVDPKQVDEIIKRAGTLARARLTVTRDGDRDAMTLQAEAAPGTSVDTDAIAAIMREVTKLSGAVEIVEAGAIANDGKVIDDRRDYAS